MRTFLADFDHQQRFGRNPLMIQLGLIHGSLWCYPAFGPSGKSFMRVLPVAKTLGKIAPGRAGAELPEDRLLDQPVALVAVAPDMAGAGWKQMFNSCKLIVAQCMASQRRPPNLLTKSATYRWQENAA